MSQQIYHTSNRNGYEGTVRAAQNEGDAIPVIPLPNPGEGGPVDSGASQDNGGGIPVIPLPNPGEGGPVNSGNRPPFPPIFRPVFPGGSGAVTVIPGITFPCYSCSSAPYGRVRILNGSSGYHPFYVYLGSWLVASSLGNGDITRYVQAVPGRQTVTISGADGYVYVQKQIQVRSSSSMTLAIINTASGLDVMEISDLSCSAPSGNACLRVCSLSQDLGPFDVTLESGRNSYTPFTNIRYREVTPYTSFYPGWYQMYISRTGAYDNHYIATASASMNSNHSYTLYLFNGQNTADGLSTLVVSN